MQAKNSGKLKVVKAFSSGALLQLRHTHAKFDFIYIDGSHVALDVLSDAVPCWPMLDVGGMLAFDESR
ncbi:hypothetical protein EJ08DRAFT_529646 [Tothia fuscella]|uniref:Class I SAM-dependent methyltransferase n=1 Tax=Tothia fuscella TaxID=1048955 RepID=A0A9P4NGI4_9PEZI|nr:hypothetical protein EJ08DRAFT_529646 [Tothia fuscella]